MTGKEIKIKIKIATLVFKKGERSVYLLAGQLNVSPQETCEANPPESLFWAQTE